MATQPSSPGRRPALVCTAASSTGKKLAFLWIFFIGPALGRSHSLFENPGGFCAELKRGIVAESVGKTPEPRRQASPRGTRFWHGVEAT